MKKKTQRRRRIVKKVAKDCFFCKQDARVDYKDIETLKRYLTERGKIVGHALSGVCQKHQKDITVSIKRARHLALLPFIVRPS